MKNKLSRITMFASLIILIIGAILFALNSPPEITIVLFLLMSVCVFLMFYIRSVEASLVEVMKKGCSKEEFLILLSSRMYSHSDKEILIKNVFTTMFTLESKHYVTREYYSGTHIPILLWSLQEENMNCKKDNIWDLSGLDIKEMWKSCEDFFILYGREDNVIQEIGKVLYEKLKFISGNSKELNNYINSLDETIHASDDNLKTAKSVMVKFLRDYHIESLSV